MNKTITSKDAILEVSKKQVSTHGLQSLNIRDVANKCGVSVGSIYNYFPTKSDLVAETIESIWFEIMKGLTFSDVQNDFCRFVFTFYNGIQKGSENFPDFFTSHSMSVMQSDKVKGKEKMEQYFVRLKSIFFSVLSNDRKVKQNAFTKTFTKEDFIDFVLTNMVSLLSKKANSCDFLTQVISKIIY